jgi:hypothetical protein
MVEGEEEDRKKAFAKIEWNPLKERCDELKAVR